jgi:hypothetical protein
MWYTDCIHSDRSRQVIVVTRLHGGGRADRVMGYDCVAQVVSSALMLPDVRYRMACFGIGDIHWTRSVYNPVTPSSFR